ncbi:MAG: pilus assembly protein CpaB [Actinomycetota bacterium]|jgi:pilus assembly protein CpaB|nr:pilus assembly protein CpaB [Actinomycetota bacterium]
MGRRTVLLVAAILVAALGAGLVMLYVHNVNQHVKATNAPQQILVAKKLIPAGTTGETASIEGDLEFQQVPKAAVAVGALDDIAPVANQVALAPIYPGEQILGPKFGKQGDSTALNIPTAGTMALSISLGGPARVNGFIVPGSDVAVFLSAGGTTQLILDRVKVIAVGTRTLVPSSGQTSTTQQQSDVVTFGVTQAEAQKLIFAQASGAIYLTLLTADSTTAKLPPTTSSNVAVP